MRTLLLVALMILGRFVPDDTEAFFEAARKGDVAAVKALLAKGVPVDARWRYDTTALHTAARRGHVEVVKVLLDAGADATVKDSFYGMTVLDGALSSGSIEILRMLFDKKVRASGQVLLYAVGRNRPDIVRLVLERGGVDSETLSTALGRALKANRTEIADVLRAAGAVPPPDPTFQVEAETLARYGGTYRNEREAEIVVALKEGKLVATGMGQSHVLGAFDKVTFRPGDEYEIQIIFRLEGDKVTGLDLKQSNSIQSYKRVETK